MQGIIRGVHEWDQVVTVESVDLTETPVEEISTEHSERYVSLTVETKYDEWLVV